MAKHTPEGIDAALSVLLESGFLKPEREQSEGPLRTVVTDMLEAAVRG